MPLYAKLDANCDANWRDEAEWLIKVEKRLVKGGKNAIAHEYKRVLLVTCLTAPTGGNYQCFATFCLSVPLRWYAESKAYHNLEYI